MKLKESPTYQIGLKQSDLIAWWDEKKKRWAWSFVTVADKNIMLVLYNLTSKKLNSFSYHSCNLMVNKMILVRNSIIYYKPEEDAEYMKSLERLVENSCT